MRIFVCSTFEDLREHRAAAIRVLRQLGHEVRAMEDMVAASEAPLGKVLELVDRSEAYVGDFAWRYGIRRRHRSGRRTWVGKVPKGSAARWPRPAAQRVQRGSGHTRVWGTPPAACHCLPCGLPWPSSAAGCANRCPRCSRS